MASAGPQEKYKDKIALMWAHPRGEEAKALDVAGIRGVIATSSQERYFDPDQVRKVFTGRQARYGSNAVVQVAWMVPNTESNRIIHVVVDPSLVQADCNRANNTATLSTLAPDLQISDITVLQPSPTNRVINARCINNRNL
jgi:hypothetical protein